jgi:threonine dehydratase
MTGPTIDHIRAAAQLIQPHVHRTPVITSKTFDQELGATCFFKCENLQKVGAFKARGAVNAVLSLDPESAARGVITHSSGNHGAAVSYAASIRDIDCTVVMPEGSPYIKIQTVRGYGAEVVFCERDERDAVCEKLRLERGMVLIHPFENEQVIAGQGTAALELLEQVNDLDVVIAPIGGGGILSGTAITVKSLQPQTAVWGAEPLAADDAFRSMQNGKLHPAVKDPQTVADGLMTGLGQINYKILRERDVKIERVSEEGILEAARYILERMKVVVEPSGATVLAALRQLGYGMRGKRIGAIFTGGNTDFLWFTSPTGNLK